MNNIKNKNKNKNRTQTCALRRLLVNTSVNIFNSVFTVFTSGGSLSPLYSFILLYRIIFFCKLSFLFSLPFFSSNSKIVSYFCLFPKLKYFSSTFSSLFSLFLIQKFFYLFYLIFKPKFHETTISIPSTIVLPFLPKHGTKQKILVGFLNSK